MKRRKIIIWTVVATGVVTLVSVTVIAEMASNESVGKDFKIVLPAEGTPPFDAAVILIDAFVKEPAERTRLHAKLTETARATAARLVRLSGHPKARIEGLFYSLVRRNLEQKVQMGNEAGHPFTLSAGELERTVIEFEAFRLESFVTSGVFPKRYFGYFDLKWDTAELERTLRDTIHKSVKVANAWLADRGSPLRITDAEVAVTFIAEGGAILLREHQSKINDLHPVADVGLDDIGTGFRSLATLVVRLDSELRTGLAKAVPFDKKEIALERNLGFCEALAATTVMWVYEKELAAKKLRAAGRKPLHEMALDEQFIVTSLMYNSGLVFGSDRVEALRRFETAAYLFKASKDNEKKRWPLDVLTPREAMKALLETGEYPDQPTSWNAVYHVLQRYGAYVALKRYGEIFDEKDKFIRAGP